MTNDPQFTERRVRPDGGLGNDLADAADRRVGSPRDDVRQQRSRLGWRRVGVALGASAVVVVGVVIYRSSFHRTQTPGPTIASAPHAEGSAAGETHLQSGRASAQDTTGLTMDFSTLDAGTSPHDTSAAGAPAPRSQAAPALPQIRTDTSFAVTQRPFVPADTALARTLRVPGQEAPGGTGSSEAGPEAPGMYGGAGTRGAPASAWRPLTVGERMKRAAGASGGGSSIDQKYFARFQSNQSVLAPPAPTTTGAGGALSADAASVDFVPGVRTTAHVETSYPSAGSGEPIEALLDAPLINRGAIILPAGTRAIGKGSAITDGTNQPRLLITFTTFVLPDQTVRHYAGVSYDLTDGRVGLNVPFNRQVGQRLQAIGTAAALAYGVASLIPNGSSNSSVFAQPDPATVAKGQAYNQAEQSVAQQLNVGQPAAGVLLKLDTGTQFAIVFGMGN